MTRLALAALLAAVPLFAHADDKKVDAELKDLKGTWQTVELEIGGKKFDNTEPTVKALKWVIDGEGLSMSAGMGKDRRKTFKIDPTKTPKTMDMTSLDGQEKDQTAAGIYKLEKDKLTICIPDRAEDPMKRPKEFKTAQGDGFLIITLERVKSK